MKRTYYNAADFIGTAVLAVAAVGGVLAALWAIGSLAWLAIKAVV